MMMGEMEKQFASPHVSPADIAARVADMSSSSVKILRALRFCRNLTTLQRVSMVPFLCMDDCLRSGCTMRSPVSVHSRMLLGPPIFRRQVNGLERLEMQEHPRATWKICICNHLAQKQEELRHWTDEEELLVPRVAPRSSSSP